MNYPLDLKFKLFAIAPQIYVRDAQGQEVAYTQQKLFRLKEDIRVYRDRTQTNEAYKIKADRIIDFSPLMTVTNASGQEVCSVKRMGMKSLWQATYQISEGQTGKFTITEINPMIKFADSYLENIPIIGAISGLILHPIYSVTRYTGEGAVGEEVARITKTTSFFERNFRIDKAGGQISEHEEEEIFTGAMVAVLMERRRG